MTWFKLDDQWMRHPKVQALTKDAKLLWIAGGLHCAGHLTDGVIAKTSLRLLAAEADVRPTCARELVRVGLWIEYGDRYEMHDWADYQPSRDQVEQERSKARERMRNKRRSSPDVPPNVRPNFDGGSPSPTRPDPSNRDVRTQTTDDYELPAESSSADEHTVARVARLAANLRLHARADAVAAHEPVALGYGVGPGVEPQVRCESSHSGHGVLISRRRLGR